MKVGLIDVDGHRFPNLAMMKISAWHKSKGHEVDWFYGFYEYDKVFMSKIFDFTQDYQYCIRADEIKKGGRGYRPEGMTIKEYSQIDKLPYEIEHHRITSYNVCYTKLLRNRMVARIASVNFFFIISIFLLGKTNPVFMQFSRRYQSRTLEARHGSQE